VVVELSGAELIGDIGVTANEVFGDLSCCAMVALPVATFDAILTIVRSIIPELQTDGLTSVRLERKANS
jgi:hypothetical protein